MNYVQTLLIAALLAFSLASASAFALDALPQQGDKLESSGELALRASSPDAAFGTKGEKIGWLKQGDTVKVLEVKQVSTVFGFEVWVRVESATAQGWIFDGMARDVLAGQAHLAQKESLLASVN